MTRSKLYSRPFEAVEAVDVLHPGWPRAARRRGAERAEAIQQTPYWLKLAVLALQN